MVVGADIGSGIAPPDLTGQEFVAHVYAPVHGSRASAGYDTIRKLWAGLRREFMMDEPIRAFGVPAALPPTAPPALESGLIAAQECRRPGVYQALLRRVRDVLSFSAMLAPPAGAGDWRQLDDAWTGIVDGDHAGALLGGARLYLGRADVGSTGGGSTRLPPVPAAAEQSDQFVTTDAGFRVWELGPVPDNRAERRIVVIGGLDQDAELSAWTWSRGDPILTPLARYLMHAAKVRHHLRLWADGQPTQDLRRHLDAAVDAVDSVVPSSGGGSAPPGDPAVLRERLLALDVARGRVSRALADVQDIHRSVRGSAQNLAAWAEQSVRWRDAGGLFADDRELCAWFTRQLAEDVGYLRSARDRAAAYSHLGRSVFGGIPAPLPAFPTPPAPGPELDRADIAFAEPDRSLFRRALARAFGSEAAASAVLDAVGFPVERRRNIDRAAPDLVWSEIINDLDNGLVAHPYRRLLAAALDRYPHNETFTDLARRYG